MAHLWTHMGPHHGTWLAHVHPWERGMAHDLLMGAHQTTAWRMACTRAHMGPWHGARTAHDVLIIYGTAAGV